VRLPHTTVPGARFPAVPSPAAALVLSLQQQLDESQWLAPDALRDLQLAQLDEVVRHAASAPFWRDRLAAAGWAPGRPVDWDVFARLPVLSRADLQAHEQAVRALPSPQAHGATNEVATSGSTGRPVRVLKTDLCDLMWRAVTLRDHRWHRRDLGAKLAAIRYVHDATRAMPPHGERTQGWGPSTDPIYPTGPAALLSLRADPRDQAKWLRREDPAYLLTYPSNLKALAREFADRGKRLPALRQIRTVSEMLSPEVRALAEQVFGVPVVDVYSTQEIGNVALQCPDHTRFHVQSETVVVEVLDGDGRPVGPGEVGRVVVTALHNFATPLLRYDVGDLAQVGPPCPCGRGLPVLERVLGRVRNLLVYPDGRRVWPVFNDGRFASVAPIRQYQIVQVALDRLVVRLVADRAVTALEEDALRDLLAARLGTAFSIAFDYPARIERDPSGKFEDFRSEILAGKVTTPGFPISSPGEPP